MVISADKPVLEALEATAERLLARHLSAAKEWFPHTLVPWDRAAGFDADYEWSVAEANLAPRGAQCFVRQRSDRGQPAVLLPRH